MQAQMALTATSSPGQQVLEDELIVELEEEALEGLEQVVQRPAFLHALETAASYVRGRGGSSSSSSKRKDLSHPLALDLEQAPTAGPPGEPEAAASSMDTPNGGFEIVEKDHAVEAMAYYIAQCLAKHPDAQVMSPKQLQQALGSALKSMKQSKFRRLCTLGRHAYRWTTLSYSALQVYQNPWLVQAILTALWTFTRLGARAFMP